MKKFAGILSLVAILFCPLAVHAEDLWVLNEQLTIQQTNNNIRIDRTLQSRDLHNDEFIRGNDLARAVRDLVQKIKDAVALLKGRQRDQIRATEIARITESNTQDAMRRNKVVQQLQQSSQRALLQDLKTKNKDLAQRVKDLSRR
ncbi:MAG TPA: hypothetical protein PKV41_03610 [Candidatus Omnitrophota bacterium]|nr:hypothetical protein [Candidatus Omnitrophota bacterium]